jgi:D-glycero-D-manno-heptose 1,7-bisphosphate phosphatase
MSGAGPQLRPAVFLDRDGTINEEREYLWRTEDLAFIPGAPQALGLLQEAGFVLVVVTNQSGLGRGYYDEDDLHRLHRFMAAALARDGVQIAGWYFCPHHPEGGQGDYLQDCSCRKPRPGMLLEAARDLGLDLGASWMVGDKVADVTAGWAAGCRSVLVRTGYGAAEARRAPDRVPVVADLLAAARLIVSTAAGQESSDNR